MSKYCGHCGEIPIERGIYCSTRCRVEAYRDRLDPNRKQRRLLRQLGPRHQMELMEHALRAIADSPERAEQLARLTLTQVNTMRLVRGEAT